MLGEIGFLALSMAASGWPGTTPGCCARVLSVVQQEQQTWGKLLMGAAVLLWNTWFMLMGLNVGRDGHSQVPLWLQVVGALGIPLCALRAFLVFRENSYAAPVMKIPERGTP